MLMIQVCALGVVLTYYFVESSQPIFEAISTSKMDGGLLFAAIATIISGGIIPEVTKRIFRPANIAAPQFRELVHQFIMWAWLGILIEAFYRYLAQLLGHGTDALTLASKVLVDQFIFTPLLSLPLIVIWFLLYESGYQPSVFAQKLRLKIIYARVFPLWATCLSFWPIMLTIIFSLPQPLQFVLFLFGNAAYSILMIFILRRQAT
ncbi:MAG: hypothetical protein AAGC73_07440 [Verrucomicrobiota bacterium]